MIRRNKRKTKKPLPVISLWTIGLSLLSGILFAVCIWITYNGAGKVPKLIVGLGTVGMFTAIASAVVGYKEFKKSDFLSVLRVLGMILPMIAAILWVFIYIYGLFVI
ncbi:MAG: hypothetical protein K6F00_01325 [Lachnospiraceae bacterium]|nr:hypothetical protein [Lachnospiraceae bacterium]